MTSLRFIFAICLLQSAFCNFLIGTGSDSIYHVRQVDGQYKVVNKFYTGGEPNFISLSNDKNFLYTQDIQSYHVIRNGNDIDLQYINQVSTTGEWACYQQLTKDNKFIAVANYRTNYAVFAIQHDGSVSENPVQYFPKRDGHGLNPDRQDASHPHQIYLHPNQENVYVSDLGLDMIIFYKIKDGYMTAGKITYLVPGTGPRHLTTHPSNPKVLYGANELSGNINRYEMNQDGSLNLLESYPFHPTKQLLNSDTGAEVVVTNAGYLYFSLRGQNLISVFKVNDNTQLTFIQTYSSQGNTPRYITLNPDESQLFVLHQDSNSFAIFNINGQNLDFQALVKGIQSPQSMVFL